jgi:Tol biopolymer transport system component
VWSVDGRRIVFAATHDGVAGIYEKLANGAGEPQLLLASPEPVAPHGFSPDGKFLVYSRTDPKTKVDLWLLPLAGDKTPRPYLQTQFDESHGQVSPDGRFLVYESNENTVHEIYVRTFPDPSGGKWQISRGRGGQPRWSPDGKKIYFLNGGRTLTEVPVRTQPAFEAGTPKDLYAITVPGSYNGAQGSHFAWALSAGGVVALTSSESNAPVMVIENWRAKLPH